MYSYIKFSLINLLSVLFLSLRVPIYHKNDMCPHICKLLGLRWLYFFSFLLFPLSILPMCTSRISIHKVNTNHYKDVLAIHCQTSSRRITVFNCTKETMKLERNFFLALIEYLHALPTRYPADAVSAAVVTPQIALINYLSLGLFVKFVGIMLIWIWGPYLHIFLIYQ
jgi:hypothetical protein